LKTHLLFALALVALLWFHVPLRQRQSMICLAVASGLWIVQGCAWFGRLGYQNFRSRHAKGMRLTKHSCGSAEATEATMTLKRPWNVRPGEHVYITSPVLGRHHGGFAQAHPYTIAWTDESDIILIIQRHTGFSSDIFTTPKDLSSFVVDGPYGHPRLLTGYDKVLFAASDIGVAAHLLGIRSLSKAHEDQSARVRRITLLWFLESPGTLSSSNLTLID
jgi:predicted ferric reductase